MKETILMIPSRSSATGTPLHPHRHTSYSSRVHQQLGEESAPGRVSDHVRRPREQHGEGLEQGRPEVDSLILDGVRDPVFAEEDLSQEISL
jgi:hypothetical protein